MPSWTGKRTAGAGPIGGSTLGRGDGGRQAGHVSAGPRPVVDHVYMPGPCRTLARESAQTAFDNADNWCYYATSFIYSWP